MQRKELSEAIDRLIKEVGEFRQVADSLPLTSKKPGTKKTGHYLGG